MNIENRIIDHLVYCVPNLEEGIKDLEEKLGVKASIGGKHITQGTKNALINLGGKCYLEILAIDEDNHEVTGERWMGIELITQAKLTRWSLKSTNLNGDQEILKRYNEKLAQVKEGSRNLPTGQHLIWKMTLPLSTPEVELAPFMVDWSKSDAHPTDKLVESCSLKQLKLHLPASATLAQHCLNELGCANLTHEAPTAKITALISGPKGIIEI